jgi:alcohol dehydrogenase
LSNADVFARRAEFGCRHLFMHPSGSDLAEFSRMIKQRQLKVVVDKVHPFAAIGGAFARVEAGT